MDTRTDKAHITTAWAVDYCQNMTLSFRANYPETEVGSAFCCCYVNGKFILKWSATHSICACLLQCTGAVALMPTVQTKFAMPD